MTLVVSTASARGISVVTDRAVSRRTGTALELYSAQKGWYSAKANIALAFWGNATLPDGQALERWAERFVNDVTEHDTPASVAGRLASELNPMLERLTAHWSKMRRGVHVSGYEGDLPVIFHVHTGDPRGFHHALEVHRDFPDVHVGSAETYRAHLAGGGFVQLRNGQHELFATVAQLSTELQSELSTILRTPVPAQTLRGQALFDEALVRFAAGILKSADQHQVVSDLVDIITFTADGKTPT